LYRLGTPEVANSHGTTREGPSQDRDDRNWDHPVKLLDAVRLWAPALARCLDQVKWGSPAEIENLAHRYGDYHDPTRVQNRRARAKRPRERGPNTKVDPEASLDGLDTAADRALPEPLRGDWARLLQEWEKWDDGERLVYAFELAAHLIIEKTKPEESYLLEYAPPASDDDLSGDYCRMGEARHEGLGYTTTEQEFAGRYRLGDKTSSNPEIYLTEAEFAGRYHLGRRTVQRWRQSGQGPVWVRLGE
jgi:hypothetical protein